MILKAKEFCRQGSGLKVLGTGIGKVSWQDIEIIHAPSGEPLVHLHGEANAVAAQKGLRHWSVSITHDGGLAAAVAVAIGDLS